MEGAETPAKLERELASLIVTSLRLELAPEEIRAETPIYGDHLGLDSIDMLEIALAISTRYGFEIRAENLENQRIFSSLRELARYVAAHRTS